MRKRVKIALNECAELTEKLSNDFVSLIDNFKIPPAKLVYKIASNRESPEIVRTARIAALQQTAHPLIKVAFDTRRIDAEHDRNPRSNLQYWNRSQEFIEEEDQNKINIFTKLAVVLEDIKKTYGAEPEYFESYSRVLYDAVNRIVRVKEGDLDIFRPQFAYLEQLLFARYRLSMEDIEKTSASDLRKTILKKDENLLKRGNFLQLTENGSQKHAANVILKDSNQANDLINTIFATHRKDNEKTVERTITITIRDSVLE